MQGLMAGQRPRLKLQGFSKADSKQMHLRSSSSWTLIKAAASSGCSQEWARFSALSLWGWYRMYSSAYGAGTGCTLEPVGLVPDVLGLVPDVLIPSSLPPSLAAEPLQQYCVTLVLCNKARGYDGVHFPYIPQLFLCKKLISS